MRDYRCLSAGTHPNNIARSQTMLHQELGREHRAQVHREVEHNRLNARLAREARFAKVSRLGEEAPSAKARLGEEAVLRGGMLVRGTTFVAALFR